MPLSDAWVDFLAGWCSGAAAVLACQPVDTVLTRWQAASVGPSSLVGVASTTTTTSSTAASTATTTTSLNVIIRKMTQSLMTQTPASEGYRALWRGSSPMIGAVPIQNALLMGGYGIGLQYADARVDADADDASNNNGQHHRYMAIFVGGCTGGVLQSFLMSPVELIKVSQQVCAGESLTSAGKDLAFNLTHASKMKVAWTGLGATLLRDGIPHGVWFVSYEACKNRMQYGTGELGEEEDSDSVVVPLVSGAVAATTAWAVGYPADLIKTRLQANAAAIMAGSSSSPPSSASSLGIVGTARQLIQEANGQVIRGLYRGFGLKLLRSVPASMIGFTTYEFVKKQVLESM